jgi:hypothetical protein
MFSISSSLEYGHLNACGVVVVPSRTAFLYCNNVLLHYKEDGGKYSSQHAHTAKYYVLQTPLRYCSFHFWPFVNVMSVIWYSENNSQLRTVYGDLQIFTVAVIFIIMLKMKSSRCNMLM